MYSSILQYNAETDINRSVYPKSKYLGRCLEGIRSESNTTINESRDCSSTVWTINSVLHPLESTVIFIYKNKNKNFVTFDEILFIYVI